ncbi:hypothetical protein [Pseudoalteromonas rhizosphaerae]|uniref:hypothetical protein n=1 Tax=Pseudoalteromonas rhizosphaerae TaxID=2518973 RepID=UPI001230541A|nr:hypothetical protein [Pseudoalteromonas rhizosphaerae]
MATKINKANFFAKMGVLHREKVSIEGFGDVWIKALNIKQQEEFENLAFKDSSSLNDEISLKSLMVIKTAEDEAGNKLFDMDDLEQLSTMAAAPINKMFSVASRINNVTQSDIDELTKN